MALAEILLTTLGLPLGKFLLKSYLQEPVTDVAGGLLDIASKKITTVAEQRKAERQFEDIGETIVARLLPLFEGAKAGSHLNPEAVALEVAATLDGQVNADFFVARDLDAAQLEAALRSICQPKDDQFSVAELALYDRALSEAVRYLVDIAAQLPKFEASVTKASLERLSRISTELGQVLDTGARIDRKVEELLRRAQAGDDKAQRYEADYRRAVVRNLDYMELFGADLRPESRRQALSVAYVSLNLLQSRSGESLGSLPVESVLDNLTPQAGLLLLRGEAGSGKSTLFRWAALEAATLRESPARRERMEHPLAEPGHIAKDEPGGEWRRRVPFLLRLRDCKEGRLPLPDEFPLHIAKELGHAPADWVRSILQEGRGLVLLDGVDEVPNQHRENLRSEVKAIVEAYPGNFYLLSTRPAAVEEDWLATLGFREVAVDPMSDTDKAQFIRKWHEAVARELERLGQPDAALPQTAAELIAKLPANPPINRLASNPLLCAMICALHRERGQKLPKNQPELCEAICHMLLHRRERESGFSLEGFSESYRVLSYEQKRAVVQQVAHYMVRNGESSITHEQACQSVKDALRGLSGCSPENANAVLASLIERSGVLREARPGAIDFIHNTIKEYLAADRFVDDGDLGLLSTQATDRDWQQVILFAVGTRRRDFATALITRVLDPKQSKDSLRARQLFALRCRALALHLKPELETKLTTIERDIIPPRSMADAEALSTAGDTAVEFLRYRDNLGEQAAAASVRTLRLIGTDNARQCLEGYYKDTRTTVVSELAQAVNPLLLKAVQEVLLRGATLPDGIRQQISDLSPLAGLSNLQRLDLRGTQVADVTPLAGLGNLQFLNLADTRVADVTPLAGLSNLQVLSLSGTRVADVTPLAGLSNLQFLHLRGTQVKDISCLRHPKCHILR